MIEKKKKLPATNEFQKFVEMITRPNMIGRKNSNFGKTVEEMALEVFGTNDDTSIATIHSFLTIARSDKYGLGIPITGHKIPKSLKKRYCLPDDWLDYVDVYNHMARIIELQIFYDKIHKKSASDKHINIKNLSPFKRKKKLLTIKG